MTPAELRVTIRTLGITQRTLAKRLGLREETVSRWANGKIEVPQYAVAYLEKCKGEQS
jgi:transcriptional regulator with XRE-family HTH domain